MNVYIAVKVVHVLSATILFGTGLGIAFFKWIVDRSNNVSAIRVVSEKVVFADWVFTTPAILVQAFSGAYLAATAGFSPTRGWLLFAILLFLFAGACWIPVVWLQMRMRNLAQISDRTQTRLPPEFYRYARIWFALGVPAFLSLVVVFWLMVAKPG